MADRIAEITVAANTGGYKYPWNEWLDGSSWRLIRGEDYDIEDNNMRMQVRGAAKRRNLQVIVVSPSAGVVELQAYESESE